MRPERPWTFLAGCRRRRPGGLVWGCSAIALIPAVATLPGKAAAQAKFVEEGGAFPTARNT